jgi:hypothetical protein
LRGDGAGDSQSSPSSQNPTPTAMLRVVLPRLRTCAVLRTACVAAASRDVTCIRATTTTTPRRSLTTTTVRRFSTAKQQQQQHRGGGGRGRGGGATTTAAAASAAVSGIATAAWMSMELAKQEGKEGATDDIDEEEQEEQEEEESEAEEEKNDGKATPTSKTAGCISFHFLYFFVGNEDCGVVVATMVCCVGWGMDVVWLRRRRRRRARRR